MKVLEVGAAGMAWVDESMFRAGSKVMSYDKVKWFGFPHKPALHSSTII